MQLVMLHAARQLPSWLTYNVSRNMHAKIVSILVAFFAVALPRAPAEWSTLSDPDGRTYEVAVDFRIDDLRIAPNGSSTFVALGSKDGKEIGFSAKISKPEKFREADRLRVREQTAAVLMQCAIDVTSIGTPTKALERFLNAEIARDNKPEDFFRVVGPLTGFCPVGFGHHISETSLYTVTDSRMTYDDSGKLVVGDLFSLTFIIDAPRKRLTAYFSRPPNMGGVSGRSSGRFQWYEAQRKKG